MKNEQALLRLKIMLPLSEFVIYASVLFSGRDCSAQFALDTMFCLSFFLVRSSSKDQAEQ